MELTVAAIQFAPVLMDVEANINKTVELLEKAAEMGVEIAVLPELSNTGYSIPDQQKALEIAELAPGGASIERWESIAKANNMYIVAGIAERTGFKVYNSSVLIGPRGHIATYRKLHLFNKEKRVFSEGNLDLWVHKSSRGFNIGTMICFDWAFPEVARVLALMGADIIAHPSNLVLPYGQKAMVVRAIENHVYTITANRIGEEGDLKFTGKSIIVSPKGEILAEGSEDQEEIITAKIDINDARNKKITPLNDLFKDRRPKYYQLITKM